MSFSQSDCGIYERYDIIFPFGTENVTLLAHVQYHLSLGIINHDIAQNAMFYSVIKFFLQGGNLDNRLGLSGFSGSAMILVSLEDYMEYFQDIELNFYKTLENLQYMGGTTNLWDALM